MKKRIAAFLLCLMLALAPAAMADERMDTLDYAALEAYAAAWTDDARANGLELDVEAALKDDYFTLSTYLHAEDPQRSGIIETLTNEDVPIDLLIKYYSFDNSVILVYGQEELTEVPKAVEIYADGAGCGGSVEVYPAESPEESDLYTLEFSLDCIRTLLNAEDAFMRLTTDRDVYYQPLSYEDIPAPWVMFILLSDGLDYAQRGGSRYLDPGLMPDDADAVSPAATVPPANSFQNNYEAIDLAAQSVFLLEVYDADDQLTGTGSGFVAFDSGTLITNEHVIDGAAYVIAHSDHYRSAYKLTGLIASDSEKDIAILAFDESANVQPLTIDTQSRLLRGQPVTAIGSPKGVLNTVSSGNISNIVDYSSAIPDCIQFTAPISPGSSGGALFSDSGAVIGLCVSSLREGDAMYYAIPMKYVSEMYSASRSKAPMPMPGSRAAVPAASDAGSKADSLPLIFTDAKMQIERMDDDLMKANVEMRNTSSKTITAYKLYAYTLDSDGNRLLMDNEVYALEVDEPIGPGETCWSGDLVLEHSARISAIYVAVCRVTYADGTTVTDSSPDYDSWGK